MITITIQYVLAINNALDLDNITYEQVESLAQNFDNTEFHEEDDMPFNLNLTFNELQIRDEDEK